MSLWKTLSPYIVYMLILYLKHPPKKVCGIFFILLFIFPVYGDLNRRVISLFIVLKGPNYSNGERGFPIGSWRDYPSSPGIYRSLTRLPGTSGSNRLSPARRTCGGLTRAIERDGSNETTPGLTLLVPKPGYSGKIRIMLCLVMHRHLMLPSR